MKEYEKRTKMLRRNKNNNKNSSKTAKGNDDVNANERDKLNGDPERGGKDEEDYEDNGVVFSSGAITPEFDSSGNVSS